jgi:putative ABC transport system substrate-binding protein
MDPISPIYMNRPAPTREEFLKGPNRPIYPVQQAVKFELVINLRTAKAFGITVPPEMLTRAEVIE